MLSWIVECSFFLSAPRYCNSKINLFGSHFYLIQQLTSVGFSSSYTFSYFLIISRSPRGWRRSSLHSRLSSRLCLPTKFSISITHDTQNERKGTRFSKIVSFWLHRDISHKKRSNFVFFLSIFSRSAVFFSSIFLMNTFNASTVQFFLIRLLFLHENDPAIFAYNEQKLKFEFSISSHSWD